MQDLIKTIWFKYPKKNIKVIQRYLSIYYKISIDKVSLNKRKC